MNLKIDVHPSPHTADFNLTVQAYDHNGSGFVPIATIGVVNVDDPNLGIRLRDMFQAYRMGTLYGEREMTVAGSELPSRGEGVDDTSVIRYPSGEFPNHHAK